MDIESGIYGLTLLLDMTTVDGSFRSCIVSGSACIEVDILPRLMILEISLCSVLWRIILCIILDMQPSY